MSRTRYILLAIPFVGGVSIASISPAVAQTNSYPGIMCVETVDSAPEIYYTNGIAYNDNGTYDASFTCPIPRHQSDIPGSLTNIFARVVDAHPTETVQCHATSCNALRTSCELSMNVPGNDSLFLGSLPTFTNGMAYVYCTIPDKEGSSTRSGVISYRATD